jgi:hypothetical protein
MDTSDQPKKQSLAALGGLLIVGGIIVLRSAGTTDAFYENIGEQGGASWASGLAWLMILGGGVLLLTGLAATSATKD